MKQLVSVSLALMMSATTMSLAQRRFGDGPVIVTLPQGFDTRSCQFKYFLVGSFGGYGGFVQPKLHVSEYEIETVHDGIAVEKLKAFLSCLGYPSATPFGISTSRFRMRWVGRTITFTSLSWLI